MENLKMLMYVVGQTVDAQRGNMDHFIHDCDLICGLIYKYECTYENVVELAQIYEHDLIAGNYDGADDDWDANRIRYCGRILREIAENI